MRVTATFQNLAHYDRPASVPTVRKRRGCFRRMFDAIAQSRQRRLEQELALRFGLNFTDARLTDEIERQIDEYLTRNRGFRL